MLRTVRSLPSLRLLYQQEAATLKGQVQAKSTYSYTCGELFQPSTTAIRNVHQTAKKETILLDSSSEKSRYTTMNLQGLKMECKKRGLKVSGRKLDLVQRLVSQDQFGAENSRSFTNISSNNASSLSPPNPKFSLLDKQIKESKIAEAIRRQKKHDLMDSHKKFSDSKEVRKAPLNNSASTNGSSQAQSVKHSAEMAKLDKTGVQKSKASEEARYKEERKMTDNKLSLNKTSERKSAQLKLQAQKREAEKKASELKAQADRRAAEVRLQRAREAQELKLQAEKKAAEKRVEMQQQKQREAEELKLQAEKKAAELKHKMMKEAEELKLREATKKADIQTREKVATITEAIKQSVIKQSTISQILNKAHDQSKVDVVASAKRQLQDRAKLVQQKQQQQQQQKEQRKEQSDNLNSRDVKFLTAFGLSTIGWWSLKESSI